ncbi:hypothetical protein [Lacticaseibacillus sp. 53-4]|uniref:hypothetical protein n=1 Tax=Lacticaseibacillus sp. 53-4 TaxID=2799575 RepID=UPI001943F3BA|nr:hypothetical protein [Lacticaseibacillus sp. 53-4]
MQSFKKLLQKMPRKLSLCLWAIILLLVALGFTSLAQLITTHTSNYDRAIDFFGNFGAAAIAALFVVYQASRSHEDVQEQIAHENRIQQATAYNKVRPMLFFLQKTFKAKDAISKVQPGDRIFIMSKGLDELEASGKYGNISDPSVFVNFLNNFHEASVTLFELRLFYGEPVHHVRISFKNGTGKNSRFYIPFLEPGKNNIIISGDMLKAFSTYQAEKATKTGNTSYGKFDSPVPSETVVKKLISDDILVEFDTVLHEHVKITFTKKDKEQDPQFTIQVQHLSD